MKIIGLDLGGNSVNVTAYDGKDFLIEGLCEIPSMVREGPEVCIRQLLTAFEKGLEVTGWKEEEIDAVGLGSPGPVSGDGRLCATGATNFGPMGYENFPLRATLAERLNKPVSFLNDGNAAGLYAHWKEFGEDPTKTSVSLIVGTGLGGGVVASGRVLVGKVGFAAELGHVTLPGNWNPVERIETRCNCGKTGDLESVASLTGIELNLLPHYLPRYPGHELHDLPIKVAAKKVRSLAEAGDPLAREIFQAQAWALAATIDQMINIFDPDAVFIGGGVVEASESLRSWYLNAIRETLVLREEQIDFRIEIIPDGDRAGARGVAVYAAQELARK